ncbi:MAG: CDP-glycerol glycerophosphotransferase family protein [Oscillospiraceae bacterium]
MQENITVMPICENTGENPITERSEITELLKKKKRCGVIRSIAFRRIIIEITGELYHFDQGKVIEAWFVTEDNAQKIVPQHFDVEGTGFRLTMNVLSAAQQSPIPSGNYYLLFRQGSAALYPALISAGFVHEENDDKSNPVNLKIYKSANHLFSCLSKSDLDTGAFYLAVTYKYPAPPLTFFQKRLKNHQARVSGFVKFVNQVKLDAFQGWFRFFNRHVRKKGNVILFTSGSRAEIGGNEEFIYNRMRERGLDKDYQFRFDFKPTISTTRSPWKMLRFVYYLATSDVVILDDYYPEIYKVEYDLQVKVVQVWHACGAFKSLGLERMGKPGAPALNTNVHKCYTHVPVSSYHSTLHHAEAFGIDEDKFLPIGIPRTDIFFDPAYKERIVPLMYAQFPAAAKAKKVYLYAPTFRGDNAFNAFFPFDKIDYHAVGKFCRETGAVFLFKMHPFVSNGVVIPAEYADCIIDASGYREVNDILFIVDVLITDYSSIIYEFSLLRRPMYFFAFDQKMYESTRDFYEPYEQIVPGKIVKDFGSLMEALKRDDYDYSILDAFIRKNFTYTDGKATDRFIDEVILDKPAKYEL